MTNQSNLIKAIINVMKDVKGIDKNLTVGEGKSAYKGVADKDVKKEIGEAMQNHGLCIVPISIEPKTTVDRWEEITEWGKKSRQLIFTEVQTKYLLMHESGEYIEIVGYGHGADSQDKSAGKATTYALKYALLYAFMIPTGSIDDSDKDSSDNHPTPQQDTRPWLTDGMMLKAIDRIRTGEPDVVTKLEQYYRINKTQREKLNNATK